MSLLTEGQLEELVARLSIYREDAISKEIVNLQLFEQRGSSIGIPRQYALEKMDCSSATDCTKWELIPFPDFSGVLRPYQQISVDTFLEGIQKNKYGGIAQAACGGGKTVFMIYILSLLKVRTLVLLHKMDLMEQWQQEIKKFLGLSEDMQGWVKQDNQVFLGKPITIASYQTVRARQDDLFRFGFFDYFSCVVADEVHRTSALTYQETIKLFSAKLQLGLTATPRRRDGLENVFFWHTGPIIAKINAPRMTGRYFQLRWSNPYLEDEESIARAISMVANDTARNLKIIEEMFKAFQGGRKVLAMTDRLDHVDMLVTAIRNRILKSGDFTSVGRYTSKESSIQLKENKKCQVIIGTFGMFSEGTDIPDADTLFLLTPRGDVEQMVGRIQRIHEDKKELIIYDIVDTGMGMMVGLGKKRVKIFEKLGFGKV